MKKIYSILAGLLLTVSVFAQAPQKMSYQAVIRNVSNVLVTSKPVGMKISVLQGTSTGTVVYSETQTPNTNSNGLVSLEIGSGIPVVGTFSGINWSNGPYFIKTETDPTGGTSYNITGTSQLLSVPYALHAKYAENIIQNPTTGYMHIDTIGNYIVKNNNGIHPFYVISSSNEVYNSVSEQLAIVGANKDNHNPIGQDDTRALMVHNDALRHLTKAVVCEPGELNISVQNDSIGALGQNPFQAYIQMKDTQKEIIIGNAYTNPSQKNEISLKKDATMQTFTPDNGSTYRAVLFDNNGVQLIKNNTVVHKVDMSGNVTMGDVLNIKPRSTAPSSPNKGTIYFDDVTNKLRVFDGTTWQNCW
jgi:hypothetical protein